MIIYDINDSLPNAAISVSSHNAPPRTLHDINTKTAVRETN